MIGAPNINIGCGDMEILEYDCVNVDIRKTEVTDIVCDLASSNMWKQDPPWPFEDEAFQFAFGIDIVEHMLWVIPFMAECWRIMKPLGTLFLRTSYFMTEQSYSDMTHFHFATLESFDNWDKSTSIGCRYNYDPSSPFKILSKKIDSQELTFTLVKQPREA